MTWHILRLQIQIGRLVANIFNKLLPTAYNMWSFRLEIEPLLMGRISVRFITVRA